MTAVISPSDDFVTTNLTHQLPEILEEVSFKMAGNLVIQEKIWESNYFGTKNIGAIHYKVTYNAMPAVLKIQGAKPKISEAEMISRFAAQNKSTTIRAPQVFAYIPWSEQHTYEALVMELITGKHVLPPQGPWGSSGLHTFFSVYQHYKQQCIKTPWIKPDSLSWEKKWKNLMFIAEQVTNFGSLVLPQDFELARLAYNQLAQSEEYEFQHAHFSAHDLRYQNEQIVLFSQLFWRWEIPFYDAVFAYHWGIIGLANQTTVTPQILDTQKQLWLKVMEHYIDVKNSTIKMQLTYALLERAVAALLVDNRSYATNIEATAHLMECSRNEIKSYLDILTKPIS